MDDEAPQPAPSNSQRLLGWGFVAVQFLLIGLLLLAPGKTAWTAPPVLRVIAAAVAIAAAVTMAGAAIRLGRGLTASPVPNAAARLRTDGLYRWVRHPIYTALLLLAASYAVAYPNLARVAAVAALALLLTVKARWEEQQLARRFADYPAYAARTPRFLPSPRKIIKSLRRAGAA